MHWPHRSVCPEKCTRGKRQPKTLVHFSSPAGAYCIPLCLEKFWCISECDGRITCVKLSGKKNFVENCIHFVKSWFTDVGGEQLLRACRDVNAQLKKFAQTIWKENRFIWQIVYDKVLERHSSVLQRKYRLKRSTRKLCSTFICTGHNYRKTSNRSPRLLFEHFTFAPGLYWRPGFY